MKIYRSYWWFVIFFVLISEASAQEGFRNTFDYLSPLPASEYIMPEQTISFRLKMEAEEDILRDTHITLTGSVSGNITGALTQASDGRTMIFYPDQPFVRGEQVDLSIHFHPGLKLAPFNAGFSITNTPESTRKQVLEEVRFAEINQEVPISADKPKQIKSGWVLNDSLPEGFPEITITHWDDPSPGYIFVSPLAYENNRFFMTILDNYATPVFYQQIGDHGVADFKVQPNGLLTLYDMDEYYFLVFDSLYRNVDTLTAGNGYTTDMHELRYYADGHSFLLAYDPQLVDMSQVVPGGQEDAVVIGLIVQELDENKNVVFQWRSWDHYEITDASNWIDLTDEIIDYVHGNSIEVVSEEELMICSRNMNEITKINRNTGAIIWRLNGENNMFDFEEAADSFCVQHSIRLMPDSSNISIFDNGGCWVPQYSSATEYELDEENFVCTLVERLQSDPDIFGAFMGNTQRTLNGHTINGWGKGIPSVTEFDTEGHIVLQFSFPHLNYRAFKYDWKQGVFGAAQQDVDFGTIPYYDSASANISLVNYQPYAITINKILNHSPQYTVEQELPIVIPANESIQVGIKFKPGSSTQFEDVMTFCWDIDHDTLTRRIAVQVTLQGSGTGNEGVGDLEEGGFTVYPNPFDSRLSIRSAKHGIQAIQLFDAAGKEVFSIPVEGTKILVVQPDILPGTYLLRVRAEDERVYAGRIQRW